MRATFPARVLTATFFGTGLILAPLCFAAKKPVLPDCPPQTQRVFYPSAEQPNWAGCLSTEGHYEGWLVQFTNQTEIMRIAHVKKSVRHGKEIRAGLPGTFEERHYSDGHLQGPSFLFRSPASLHQLLPKPLTTQDWNRFVQPSTTSLFQEWTKLEPFSVVTFENGRLTRLQSTAVREDAKTKRPVSVKVDYQFSISRDGRMMARNHPEMKGLFFVDPEALWVLNGPDLRAALMPGFGSCKQYAGPISRLGRHYDSLLYRRESSEQKHLQRLNEIRDRFVKFCIPDDIRESLGVLECPPQLPSPRPPTPCYLAISDQSKLPYHPRFFKFELTRKLPPHELQALFLARGLQKFVNQYDLLTDTLDLVGDGKDSSKVTIKKTPRGIRWKPYQVEKGSVLQDKDWWAWQGIPGF